MLKIVGTSIYAHCSNFEEWHSKCIQHMNEDDFDNLYANALCFYEEMIDESHYVLKFDRRSQSISIISSPDWDVRNEPTVGHSIHAHYNEDGDIDYKTVSGKNQVYHNKWQFVQPTYTGFNVKAAQLRTLQWNKIPNIKQLKSKIGYRQFWNQLLKENGLPL